MKCISISIFFFMLGLLFFSFSCEKKSTLEDLVIITPFNSNKMEKLAAKEIRRYIYLRSGTIPQYKLSETIPINSGSIIFVSGKNNSLLGEMSKKANFFSTLDKLAPEEIYLKKIVFDGKEILICTGGDSLGVLYGAYHFCEMLGIRFYLHGDVIPDKKIAFKIPEVDFVQKPFFEIRGIQPFHDFPEGPDWWNMDDYKAIFSQLVKMKMNFFGLHTYPEGEVGPEPTVWIGLLQDIYLNGKVKYSYPSRHFTTMGDMGWGYQPKKTADYNFGADQLFERDAFGADYMQDRNPQPLTAKASNALFNDMGEFLHQAFKYAKKLGIKTCIGTEIPLTIPDKVKEKLGALDKEPASPETRTELYQGIFERIKRTHPLDYFWFWTPEHWTWGDNSQEELMATKQDFKAAIDAAQKVAIPFTLASCGWVLGPKENRSLFDELLPKNIPMSCINRNVGFEPVEPDFARTYDRPKWAIPWLEDDPALQIPQLWVGRMRRDAADALAYGCSGLIGIHWRTRIIGPNVSALAKAAWRQHEWNKNFDKKRSYVEALENAQNPDRDLPCADFYLDWAESQFGKEVSQELAELFQKLDGGDLTPFRGEKITNLPRPANWYKGPGGIIADNLSWSKREKDYDFIYEMENLREKIKSPGNLERFDYWLNNFKYLRSIGEFSCSVGEMNRLIKEIQRSSSSDEQKEKVRNKAIPLRKKQMKELELIHSFLLNFITSPGGLGNVANWQQHIMHYYVDIPGEVLSYYWGGELPVECWPTNNSVLTQRMFLPTLRTSVNASEDFKLKLIITGVKPKEVVLFWKKFDDTSYNKIPIKHVSRAVYSCTIPGKKIKDDFEYYIKATLKENKELFFPVTAPEINQSIVIY